MNVRLEDFWGRKPWPNDGADFVFLGRAVLQIGAHLFSGEWTGAEPITAPPRKNDPVLAGLVALRNKTFRDMDHFAQLNDIRKAMSPHTTIDEFVSSFDQSELDEEISQIVEGRRKAAAAVTRILSVAAFIRTEAAEGRLQFAARPGLSIETIEEKHAGQFSGTHARYVIHSDVAILDASDRGAA